MDEKLILREVNDLLAVTQLINVRVRRERETRGVGGTMIKVYYTPI